MNYKDMRISFVKRNYLLVIAIAINLISSTYLMYSLIYNILGDNSTTSYIGLSLLFLFISALLISNLSLLFSNNFEKQFLRLNIFIAFAQIVHLKIFGFIYDVSVGPEIISYFSLNKELNFGLKYDIINAIFTLYYSESISGILLGINIFPLVVCIIYRRAVNKLKKQSS